MRTERFRGALLSALVIASLMVPAISLLFVGPSIASPATMTIYPNDDVFVSQHFSDNNYGSSIHLEANGYPSEYIYSFLKFDLSSLEASAITSATLRLYCYFVNEEQYGGPRRLGCYEVENDDWDESTVTWNDKPLMGNLLDSVYPGAEPHWENFDVTSWVENRKGQLASFGLKTTADTLGDHWEAYSKEYDNYDPYLEVNYYMPPVAVDISPTQQGGLTGATLTYTVTVTNIGTVDDNYDLAVSDSEDWGPTLSENLLENVGPGENRTVTLSVPVSGAIGTIDNITITVTSRENSEVYDNISCLAHRSKAWFVNRWGSRNKIRTKWEVWLEINALLRDDASELVLKFYTWGGSFQGENVVSTTMPARLETLWKNPHPQSTPQARVEVEKVELVLEDAQGTEIQTITTFTVTKTHLEIRFTEIPGEWAMAPPWLKLELEEEFMNVPHWWALAPS